MRAADLAEARAKAANWNLAGDEFSILKTVPEAERERAYTILNELMPICRRSCGACGQWLQNP
jgi:hypothetical protein